MPQVDRFQVTWCLAIDMSIDDMEQLNQRLPDDGFHVDHCLCCKCIGKCLAPISVLCSIANLDQVVCITGDSIIELILCDSTRQSQNAITIFNGSRVIEDNLVRTDTYHIPQSQEFPVESS